MSICKIFLILMSFVTIWSYILAGRDFCSNCDLKKVCKAALKQLEFTYKSLKSSLCSYMNFDGEPTRVLTCEYKKGDGSTYNIYLSEGFNQDDVRKLDCDTNLLCEEDTVLEAILKGIPDQKPIKDL